MGASLKLPFLLFCSYLLTKASPSSFCLFSQNHNNL